MLTIGIAVPCYGPHVARLPRLLDSIAQQTLPPARVVIESSATSPDAIAHLLDGWPFALEINTHPERRNAAQNRNAAARRLSTDLISYIDADDAMHPQRLEIIVDTATQTGAEVILHGCQTPADPQFHQDFHAHPRPWPVTINPAGEKRPAGHTRYQPVHGHVTVSRRLAHRFSQPENLTFERREDSEFVDVLVAAPGVRSAFIDLALTKYETAGAWAGAPAGSGDYALTGTGSFARAFMSLPGVRRAKPAVQAMWRQMPLHIRRRFIR